eukprot:5948121-Pleurochrysis_carterae.AAC.3
MWGPVVIRKQEVVQSACLLPLSDVSPSHAANRTSGAQVRRAGARCEAGEGVGGSRQRATSKPGARGEGRQSATSKPGARGGRMEWGVGGGVGATSTSSGEGSGPLALSAATSASSMLRAASTSSSGRGFSGLRRFCGSGAPCSAKGTT